MAQQQQLTSGYQTEVALEQWSRALGYERSLNAGWERAAGGVLLNALAGEYVAYLKEIIKRSRYSAGKFGHLNEYLQDEDTVIQCGLWTLTFLLGNTYDEIKHAKLCGMIGAKCEYIAWLNHPHWKGSWHLSGLGFANGGDLGMEAIKKLMTSQQLGVAMEKYVPLKQIERSAIGAFYVETFVEGTKMAELYVKKSINQHAKMLRYTDAYWKFLANYKQSMSLFRAAYMPMVITPNPYQNWADGGYCSIASAVSTVPVETWPEHIRKAQPCVLGAINRLQCEPLAFDPVVPALVAQAWERGHRIGSLPKRECMAEPIKFKESNLAFAKRIFQWKADCRSNGMRAKYVNFAIAKQKLDEISDQFFLVWHMDHRGRLYSRGSQINYLGSDWARQSIDFATKALVRGNEDELMFAIAQSCGEKGIMGNQLREWFESKKNLVNEVGADPHGTIGLWSGIKEPWRFVKLAVDYYQAGKDPEYKTGTPFQLDQTTSGYGHLACLTRDEWLADLTNITGDEMMDLYLGIGEIVMDRVHADIDTEQDPKRLAALKWWRDHEPGRALFKTCIMPMIYGATYISVNDAVSAYLKNELSCFVDDEGLRVGDISYVMAQYIYYSAKESLPQLRALGNWLTKIATAMIDAGYRPHWHTPNGLRVESYATVRNIKDEVVLYISNRSITIRPQVSDHPDSKGRVKPGRQLAADFVHSYDAAFLQRFVYSWYHPIVTVHDCFATTIDKAGLMRRELNEQWSRFYSVDHLTQYWGYASIKTARELPPPPIVGTLKTIDIGSNPYLFS